MISRVWHGWTTPANADAYEALLKSEIFTGIRDRQIAGYRGIHLFRRNLGDEVEFVTVMWFDTIEAVRAFAGEDYERDVVDSAAQQKDEQDRSERCPESCGRKSSLREHECEPCCKWQVRESSKPVEDDPKSPHVE